MSKTTTFKPGRSGNPAGRPKGSRNSLADAFLSDMKTEWETFGSASIKKMREESPTNFVRVVASVLPRVLETKTPIQDLSDADLAQAIWALKELRSMPEDKQSEMIAELNELIAVNGLSAEE